MIISSTLFQPPMMKVSVMSALLLLSALAALAAAAPAPEEDMAGMRSALEYLQKLDKFYSQAARPRYFLD